MEFRRIFNKARDRYLSNEWREKIDSLKNRLTSRPIILYGVGFFGAVIVRSFKENGMQVECFCDSNKRGVDPETQLNILSPDELRSNYNDANVVVAVANPSTEKIVHDVVASLGFSEKQIFSFHDAYMFISKSRVEVVSLSLEDMEQLEDGYRRAYEMFEDDNSRKIIEETINSYLFHDKFEYEDPKESYFPEQFKFTDSEVFVDGGLYTGDTTEEFIKRVGGKYSRIVGFDIDENNLLTARKNLTNIENVEIVPKGLWDKPAFLSAELGIMAGSNIKEGAGSIVELVSLDDYFSNCDIKDYPSFIKLDIEGSEREALLGAQNIIKNAKPKLAICVYHKPQDIFLLTEIIKQINPEYKVFLRKYAPYTWDTVMYAY